MGEPVPTQTTIEVAIKELRHLVTCRCTPPWSERGLHNTTCVSEYADDLDVVEAAFGLVRTQALAEASEIAEQAGDDCPDTSLAFFAWHLAGQIRGLA